MDAIVAVLLEKETLDRKEVDAIIDATNRKLGLAPETTGNDDSGELPPPTALALDDGQVIMSPIPKSDKEPPQDPQPGLQPKFA